MLRTIVHLVLTLFAIETFAAFPYQSSPRRRRDDSSSPPTINTTILSANGTDLTSTFQTMIYYESNKTTPTGLSDRQVSSRPITFCRSPTARFLASHCKHEGGSFGSVPLQKYIAICAEQPEPTSTVTTIETPNSRGPYYYQPRPLARMKREEGACTQQEICVDGVRRDYVAYCVSKEYFVRLIQRGEKQNSMDIGELEGKTARMIISQADGSTPLEARGIDLKAGVTGKVNTDKPAVQERKCRHCFELRTQKMAEGTDFLQTEANLMTAATVAAGVVWLIVSG